MKLSDKTFSDYNHKVHFICLLKSYIFFVSFSIYHVEFGLFAGNIEQPHQKGVVFTRDLTGTSLWKAKVMLGKQE